MAISILSIINSIANYVGGIVLTPIMRLSGVVSLFSISALLGIVIFIIFMLTANLRAFGKIFNDITAHILAVFLFKDNIRVTIRSEVGLLVCAGELLWYSIVPVFIMSIPLSLVLAQMAMWYQNRPVLPGKESVVVSITLKKPEGTLQKIILKETPGITLLAGPVRLADRGETYWKIMPHVQGIFTLLFETEDGMLYEKQFCAGAGFMRLSPKRPGLDFFDVLFYPLEKPLPESSPLKSIMIDYPERPSKLYGTNWWVLTFCIVSMVVALIAKPFLNFGT
ncbi:MAG: hypothetical protein N3B18_08590 [Desulfobacterota bacterium]|nr:hypothetical protein [Thermodesulfobacteriota bacterium]